MDEELDLNSALKRHKLIVTNKIALFIPPPISSSIEGRGALVLHHLSMIIDQDIRDK